MSSRKEAEVQQLEMRGRGKKKAIIKRIRQEHGTPMVSFPKVFLDIGLKLNQEVTIEKRQGTNPLKWEIVIKPKVQKKHLAKAEQ